MAFEFNFPKYRSLPYNRRERVAQAKHIRQEARETVHEAVSDDEFAMLVEAMDTIHGRPLTQGTRIEIRRLAARPRQTRRRRSQSRPRRLLQVTRSSRGTGTQG